MRDTFGNKGPFLTRDPIPQTTVDTVSEEFRADSRIGAVVSFQGVVRADDIAEGRVTAIEFSAHEEMAERAIGGLLARAVAEISQPAVRVYLRHALGTIPVGGIPIVIVVGTGHRREAFKLCSDILEALKSEVPIYGKELTDGGDYAWKRNR
jgi:molybdopterin synthase catalytic subunit